MDSQYLSLLKLRSSLFAVWLCLLIRSSGILSMSSPMKATCGGRKKQALVVLVSLSLVS